MTSRSDHSLSHRLPAASSPPPPPPAPSRRTTWLLAIGLVLASVFVSQAWLGRKVSASQCSQVLGCPACPCEPALAALKSLAELSSQNSGSSRDKLCPMCPRCPVLAGAGAAAPPPPPPSDNTNHDPHTLPLAPGLEALGSCVVPPGTAETSPWRTVCLSPVHKYPRYHYKGVFQTGWVEPGRSGHKCAPHREWLEKLSAQHGSTQRTDRTREELLDIPVSIRRSMPISRVCSHRHSF